MEFTLECVPRPHKLKLELQLDFAPTKLESIHSGCCYKPACPTDFENSPTFQGWVNGSNQSSAPGLAAFDSNYGKLVWDKRFLTSDFHCSVTDNRLSGWMPNWARTDFLKIAQHLSAGNLASGNLKSRGTAEQFFRPCGTRRIVAVNPALKCWAISKTQNGKPTR